MARWKWNAALICAALGVSACGGDAGLAADEEGDAEAVQPPNEDTDAANEEEDERVTDSAVGSDDGGPAALDAEPSPQTDAGADVGTDAGEADAASVDGSIGLDAQLDADSQADATITIDSGDPVDSSQPDVSAPPVCNADCNGHGTCTLQGSASTCACDVGYAGASCGSCSSGYSRNAADGRCLAMASVAEVRAVPPDGTCIAGGHTLIEGVDADLSGVLEPSEVTKQQVVCRVVRSGNVTVTNAAELESLRGFTDITGSLTIKAPFITTLEPLKMLVSVGGALLIEGSNSLVDLKGLSWLDSVGSMTIRTNAGLNSTEGMSALRLINGALLVQSNPALSLLQVGPLQVVQADLTITTNAELVSFAGTRLRSVVGALRLTSNDKLQTVDALAGLKAIGGALEIKQCNGLTHVRGLGLLNDVGSLTIEDDAKLADVSALAALRSVRGSVTLSRLPALQVGLGESSLAAVSGHFQFQDLPLLPRLGSFLQLTNIGGSLIVLKTGVEEIGPFPALNSFGRASDSLPFPCNPLDPLSPLCAPYTSALTIGQNPALRRFGGFPLQMNAQAHAIPSVSFYDDPQLAQLEALPFTAVTTAVRLENLASLRALPWLGLLQTAGSVFLQNTGLDRIELAKLSGSSTVRVKSNPNLTLLGIALKPTISPLEITGNTSLTTLSFPTMTQLGALTISDNAALVSFDLPELAMITNTLSLVHNSGLTRFGLPKLTGVFSATLDDNDALTDPAALIFTLGQSLPTPGSLRITNNDALRRLPELGGTLPVNIEISNNDGLISLQGFSLSGFCQVRIEDNDALPSLTGMQSTNLAKITLISNDAMTSLAGAPTTIGALDLRDNPALTSLAGASLPTNELALTDNDALVTLDGLTVPANASMQILRLEGNDALTSLTGLNNLSTLGSTMIIQNNAGLPQCAAQAFSSRVAGTSTRTIANNNTSATCP